MCNLTSIAMALETVGISNPSDDMQFEDYLEKHRLEKYGDGAERTKAKTMINIANDMGAKAEEIKIYSNKKNVIIEKLQPFLEKGYGVAISAFSYKSGRGHIIRLQSIEREGIRVDDSYGDVSRNLENREAGKSGYSTKGGRLNEKKGEKGFGENNLWRWDALKKTTIKYAIVIHAPIKN